MKQINNGKLKHEENEKTKNENCKQIQQCKEQNERLTTNGQKQIQKHNETLK